MTLEVVDNSAFRFHLGHESYILRSMAKIGRNHPCPCGSGKKFKRCHGGNYAPVRDARALPPDFDAELQRKIREMEADRVQRENQQGLGRPIISTEFAGHRMVAVGNRVHYSKQWKTFHDFLRDYLIASLGREWFKAEQEKPEDNRHPIVRWYDRAIADAKRLSIKVGDVFSGPMTGAQRAFLNLAYNIYIIAHHAEPIEANTLLDTFINKLKSDRSDDFIGKLFETYAAAAFLKAGFKLAYEDERRGGDSKVEFVATFPETGNRFSVEVKSRNRATTEDGPVDDYKRLRIASKLNKALAKKAEHTRVVMIEVNVPDVLTDEALDGWPRAALNQIREAEKVPPPDGSDKPSAYVLVTNHAFHNNLDTVNIGTQVIAAGCRIADFGPDVPFNRLRDVLESEERHREMLGLLDSMRMHYDIPSTFDGENPEQAFRPGDSVARLKFGQIFLVPGSDGREVPGRLIEAIVHENSKSFTGIYETATNKIIVKGPLTDEELAAWKRHPDTFFGEVRQVSRTVSNWLELAKFMYELYQHTDRDTLLAWMKGAQDYDELSLLSQKDLAISYCERTAWATETKKIAT